MKIAAFGLQSSSPEQLSAIADDDSIVMVDSYDNLLDDKVLQAAYHLLCVPQTLPRQEVNSTTRMMIVTSSYSSAEVCHCYWTGML